MIGYLRRTSRSDQTVIATVITSPAATHPVAIGTIIWNDA